MDVSILKRFTVCVLMVLPVATAPLSAYGEPLVPDGTTATMLDAARNGVPIINIANPNASGLSYNRFTQYNVNDNGLILNNALSTEVQTQLGGYITGNAQLSNNATLILNEVTSTNRTQLNGFTEVAGPRADLVIANPNGLTINGAGFINTNRVTLTTGRPLITDGVLQSLDVTGGAIAIQGAGLNTQDQNATAIYTQYLNLNAQIHAQNLDIKLGGNRVDYLTGTALANGAVNTQTLLLDASALGGMYANRITLVGTDRGLGVNLPPEVLASTGNIRIENDGTISLQRLSAGAAISVNSGGANITVGERIYGSSSTSLTAAGTVSVAADATVAASGTVNVSAATLTNLGSIMGGLSVSGEQQAGGAVNITADNVNNDGDIQSTGSLDFSVANVLNNAARITALGNATVQAIALDNSNGVIQTGGNLTLTMSGITLANSTLAAGGALSLTTDSLMNPGTSTISAGGDLSVQATNTVINDGDLLAGANLNLSAGSVLQNSATISAEGSLQLNADSLNNNGTISGGTGTSRITVSGNINNSSRISAADDLDVASGTNIVNSGFFNAGNNLTITSANLSNAQTLFAGNDMSIAVSGMLANAAASTVSAVGNLALQVTNDTRNDGDLLSGATLTLNTGGTLLNNATISAERDLQLDAARLNNTATISGGSGTSTINVTGDIGNTARISAVDDLVVSGAAISNDGSFNAGNNLSLTSTNLTNRQTLFAGNDMNLIVSGMLTNGTLTNMASSISAGGNLFAQVSGAVVNNGDLLAGGKLRVNTGDVLINNKTISADGSLQLAASKLNNADTISGGSGTSTISVTGNIDNGSRISAADDLEVTSGATIVNGGFFNAGNNLTLTARNLANQKTLFAGNDMNLYIADTLLNSPAANIFVMKNLTIAANAGLDKTVSVINNRANIETYQGNIDLYATSLENRTDAPVVLGTYVAASERIGGGVNLSSERVTENCGHLCEDRITTTVDTMVLLSQSTPAVINAGGNLNLNADGISNQYSLMSAAGNIYLAAAVVDNQPLDLVRLTTVSTEMYRHDVHLLNHGMHYTGTDITTTREVLGTVASTIQAGGSITGNVANLSNGNIQQQQTVAVRQAQSQDTTTAPVAQIPDATTAPVVQTQDTATASVASTLPAITLPTGTTGLFVVSPNPQSQYLVVTNPAFTSLNSFQSSAYLLERIDYSPDRTVKLLGDALYENRLIRDAVFAQTGRRFLQPDINSDAAQYQYLMDNALATQADLQLIPGVALTSAQIAALQADIVWMVEQEVAGQRVLVPEVYTSNTRKYSIEGGRIIAGDDINLQVARAQNAGLMEAGGDLTLQAEDGIVNQGGSLRAGGNLSLRAEDDIENISGSMRANNISLVSDNGDIINRRYTETQDNSSGSTRDVKTVVGAAGEIVATENLTLTTNQQITVAGSNLQGENISLDAQTVNIGSTVMSGDFSVSGGDASIKRQSTTNLASSIEGGNIAINTRGVTTVAGSSISAEENLSIDAAEIDILAVNDSSFSEERNSSSGLLSKKSTTTTTAESTSIGSSLNGGNVTLRTGTGDISVTGSNIAANDTLALDSAGNIIVQAGIDGEMSEAIKKQSGFFSGGALYSESEDLQGRMSQTAVLSVLSGRNVSLLAQQGMTLIGVDIEAQERLSGKAQNITIENADNTERTWSRQTSMTVGFGDALQAITRPDEVISYEKGKASLTLANADISEADTVTTTSEVVVSMLQAGDITLTAGSAGPGDLIITGSELNAENAINLSAGNDVSITEAKNTEQTTRSEMEGTAELRLSVQNEYVQIGYAVEAAQESKDNLAQVKEDYQQYQEDVDTQLASLRQLQTDLASGRMGIEQADVDELQSLIDDLKQDDAFYKTGIALAAADLASKTLAVASQMATAAQSSATYGFSASLEFDLNVLEQQFAAYQERSVASSLSANNISITAGNTATVQGSDLNAAGRIDISAQNTNILAAQAVGTRSNSSENRQMSVRYSTSGGPSGSASANNSQSNSRNLVQRNSQLVANNISITTAEMTIIAGANLSAADTLRIGTNQLSVTSVQNSASRRSNSQGISVSGTQAGISGTGGNASRSRSNSRETVLTTLTGNRADISVAEDTTLRGALIAAVGEDGNDNGNLNFSTGSLTVSSLNNITTARSQSAGLNVGIANEAQRDQSNSSSASSIGIDYANDSNNSKTKTLATLGSGNIQIANLDDSNITLFNRDITDNEIDIYGLQSSQSLQGTVDMRVFSEDGRNSIAEDILRAGMIANTIELIVTTGKVGITDFFSQTAIASTTYDAVKAEIAQSPELAAALQNPDLTPQQKESMLNDITGAVMEQLGYTTYDNVIVATEEPGRDGEQVRGFYSTDTQNAYINDRYNDSTEALITTAGAEATRAMDQQNGVDFDSNRSDRAEYAINFGINLASYTDMAMTINGYSSMASTNNTDNRSEYVTVNSTEFAWLDKNNGDNLLPDIVEKWLDGLNQYMEANRQSSAELQGDAVGTALSIAAFPADIVVDLTNILISTIDVITDSLGSTGILGQDLQAEALQNLSDFGVNIEYLIDNREAIVASIAETLNEYPGRVWDMDPSALRSLAAIVGEAALPVAAIARMNRVEELATPDVDVVDGLVLDTNPRLNAPKNDTPDANLPETDMVAGTDTLYRGDGRPHEQIFEEGLQPKNANANVELEEYVNSTPSLNSQYVSTSTQIDEATEYATNYGEKPGTVYYIDNPGNGIDVNETLGDKVYFPNESEIAIPGGINTCSIKGCQLVFPDGTPNGDFIPNPNYEPKN